MLHVQIRSQMCCRLWHEAIVLIVLTLTRPAGGSTCSESTEAKKFFGHTAFMRNALQNIPASSTQIDRPDDFIYCRGLHNPQRQVHEANVSTCI